MHRKIYCRKNSQGVWTRLAYKTSNRIRGLNELRHIVCSFTAEWLASILCFPSIKEPLEKSRSLLSILLCSDSQENLADLRDAQNFPVGYLLEFLLAVSRNLKASGVSFLVGIRTPALF